MKRFLFFLLLTASVMLGLPWLAVTFLQADAGMAICFLLFFAVNPVYALLIGGIAGKNRKTDWVLPLLPALLFLAGTWLLFDMGETAFLLYAGIYLLLSLLSMAALRLFSRFQK